MDKSWGKRLLHGADYYPEQWLDEPEILEEDIRMMKKAGINVVSLGVFAWSALEPEEGVWNFQWLDEVFERLYRNHISVILATPSGARPHWLADSYPEVLRVTRNRQRNLFGMRMNHCYTSLAYRCLTRKIDIELSKRYGNHPALIAWHISNEYHGECHCELCQEAFRDFLKEKYGTLEALNKAWWTGFWSKTYTSWKQLCSPSDRGEQSIQALELDWKRFVTHQTKEFMDMEIAAVREFSPQVPVTTNMMGSFPEVDYPKLAVSLDVAALDTYPEWGSKSDAVVAMDAGFEYDVTRSLKRKPFLLMETTPSMTNWTEVGKPKRPGLHMAACLQTVAHGSNSIQYFQWRKSRGAFEKFHGAVIGHSGYGNTRVFRETAAVGTVLKELSDIAGTENKSKAAVIFDWNNRWAVSGSKGPRREKCYEETVKEHYTALRRYGINVDIIDEEQSFDSYSLIAAPMLYLLKPGAARRLERFVQSGGILFVTYLSGITDENDLCFQGGFPGELRNLTGIWVEELDTLYQDEWNQICMTKNNLLKMDGIWKCGYFCETIHLETAREEAVYGRDYYKGTPVLTSHFVGAGETWYLAARAKQDFLTQLYGRLLKRAGIDLPSESLKFPGIQPESDVLPEGLELSVRQNAESQYWFLTNFKGSPVTVSCPEDFVLFGHYGADGIKEQKFPTVDGGCQLDNYETVIFKRRLPEKTSFMKNDC